MAWWPPSVYCQEGSTALGYNENSFHFTPQASSITSNHGRGTIQERADKEEQKESHALSCSHPKPVAHCGLPLAQ